MKVKGIQNNTGSQWLSLYEEKKITWDIIQNIHILDISFYHAINPEIQKKKEKIKKYK